MPRTELACQPGEKSVLQPKASVLDFGFVGNGTSREEVVLQSIGPCSVVLFEAFLQSSLSQTPSGFLCPRCSADNYPVELFPLRNFELPIFFSPTSIGLEEDALILVSTDADYPRLRIPLRATFDGIPKARVVPAWVDFGYVPLGREVTQTLRLSNQGNGTAPLEVSSMTVASSSIAELTVSPDLRNAVLLTPARGQTVRSADDVEQLEIEVRLKPTGHGQIATQLAIETNDPDQQPLLVSVRGSSFKPPRLVISKQQLDFGIVPLGQTTWLPITLSNEGGAPLHLQPNWVGPRGSDFSLSEERVIDPIEPGQFREVQVFVTATSPGELSNLLEFETNDPMQPSVGVRVHAQGEAVNGAEVLNVQIAYANGGQDLVQEDLRTVDLSMESPFGDICDIEDNRPHWGNFGTPRWLGFGVRNNPQRIVLPDARQDGIFRIYLSYREDCSFIATELITGLLGLGIDAIVLATTGSATDLGASISDALDRYCLNRAPIQVSAVISVNGEVISESAVNLQRKGDVQQVVQIHRNNGSFSVR